MQSALSRFVLLAVAASVSLCVGVGGASAQLEISRKVVASGGTMMSSSNFGVSATVGQPAAGALAGQSYSARTGFWSEEIDVVTGIDHDLGLPPVYKLGQNFPNPFNPITEIPFALPRESFVKLRVFDANGRLVSELIDELRPAGRYRERFAATSLASGIYYYRIEADGWVQTRKLVILK